ncbi:MAG TPA: 1-acyl-sn-glycerol-3-phosphate acyltransferase [Propionibacteriaceae bacterium]|nr:1-acyl-sn-glycerol-3-phosphate acyltransferase [Propionibacteriaceae bacterium]
MADAKIIRLGSNGPAGRGSRTPPSASARRLAPPRAGRRSQASADAPPTTPRSGPRTSHEDRASARNEPPFPPGPGPTAGSADEPDTSGPGGLLSELIQLASRSLGGLKAPIAQLAGLAADPVHALTSLAQAMGVDREESLEETIAFIRSRLQGDYAVDEFGFDPEFTTKIYLPLLRRLADSWFRVEVRGAENLPMDGSALLVANHAGTLPLDGMILHTVVYDEIGRHVRMLGADLIFKTPYSHDLARKTGTTLACQEDAERLLASNQLVAVFPEGFKGLGKPYADRYKLQRFGRGGFVAAALRAQVPIVPTAIVGSEEIYPLIAKAPALARALGLPYFPITPLFPWFGPLGMIPLPSKWIIQFGEAITTDELGPGAADDPMIMFNITDQVRETIQQTLYALLMQRRSAFY